MKLKSTLSRLPVALREAKASFLASLVPPKPKRTHQMVFQNPNEPNQEYFIPGDIWLQPVQEGILTHAHDGKKWILLGLKY